jgi:preprotein translocase subunit SecY
VLFTLGALLVYRLGCQIPIPGLDNEVLSRLDVRLASSVLSILALGVTPIFSALLLFELARLLVRPLARWEAERPANVRRLRSTIAVAALLMAAGQALGMANGFYEISGLIPEPGWTVPIVVTLVAATALLGWLGRRITQNGVGSGFWLLLIAPTLAALPVQAWAVVAYWQRGGISSAALAGAVVFLALATALIAAADGARLGATPTGPAAENRTSGAEFVCVWPPLFANFFAGLAVAGLALAAGGVVHLLLIALFVAAFTWLQSRSAPDGGAEAARPFRLIAVAQIAVCAGGELLTRQLELPFAIDGSWLIVVVTVALSVLRAGGLAR